MTTIERRVSRLEAQRGRRLEWLREQLRPLLHRLGQVELQAMLDAKDTGEPMPTEIANSIFATATEYERQLLAGPGPWND
jgi:hypothetical protein